jgi:hypothetical protein
MNYMVYCILLGMGASQLMAGGITSGEYSSKYARLSEICKEDGSIPYVGKDFKLSIIVI